MTPSEINSFLDGAIRSRISVRLIAEQHIALSRALQSTTFPNTNHYGVIQPNCSPAQMIRSCAAFVSDLCEATLGGTPPIEINGHADAVFA